MDVGICKTESLCCTAEIITTLQINCTLIKLFLKIKKIKAPILMIFQTVISCVNTQSQWLDESLRKVGEATVRNL